MSLEPNALFDDVNMLPLVRTGATASHIAKNYQGRDEFMVDMACFPGSSGSPVFVMDQGQAIWDRERGEYAIGRLRRYFVGVLFEGPTIDNEGRIVMTKQPQIVVNTMMHLGTVIRSTQMLEFDRLVYKQIGQPLPDELKN